MADKDLDSGYSETTAIENTDVIPVYKASSDSLWRYMTGLNLKANAKAGVEALTHTDLPKTLVKADANKVFIVDLSSATADETITLPAEATAGDGWGVEIRLTGLASGFKLNINDDAAAAVWEMNVAGQKIHPVTDGTSWYNAEPGAILAITEHTSSTTHTYAIGAVTAKITLTGGGGGGSGSDDSAGNAGAGGTAAATVIGIISGFGATETVTIGSGGAGGGVAAAGSAGTDSTWGSFLTAAAGGAGDAILVRGGNGGTASGGDININGSDGTTVASAEGGKGAASYWGSGGKNGAINTSGSNATVPGSGGGGGGEGNAGGDKTGGDGANGIGVCVEFA